MSAPIKKKNMKQELILKIDAPINIEFFNNYLIIYGKQNKKIKYSEVKYAEIKKGKINWLVTILSWLVEVFITSAGGDTYKEDDELYIILSDNSKITKNIMGVRKSEIKKALKLLNG